VLSEESHGRWKGNGFGPIAHCNGWTLRVFSRNRTPTGENLCFRTYLKTLHRW
jgi:hypothetical protein